MSFATLGLSAETLRAVAEQGYTVPTPIQAQAIPIVLEGRDLLAAAQTGTGKTAGFTLPLLERLRRDRPSHKAPRALVLTPTRELAAQVQESVRTYGKYLPLRSAVIFGGVGINPQIEALRRGVEILVATPGRLLDHASQRTVDLSRVEILVLDEADRMLDMGFIHDIRKVLALLPPKRQNLLFSATFSDDIRRLAERLLNHPAAVDVAPRNSTAERVSQLVHPVDKGRKRALLSHLVSRGDWRQVLVFTRTKHGANRLAEQLERDGLSAAAIHGNKSQNARTKALSDFKQGAIRVLVATDIAARGLDIQELPHVVNFELPNVPEDYVHRIGRTGRAGAEGEALSLVSPDESKQLDAIQRLLKREIRSVTVSGFEPGTAGVEPEGLRRAQPAARPQHVHRAPANAARPHKPRRRRGGSSGSGRGAPTG
jgi:ATP-dependent RNA helicase RhlE